MSPTTVIRAGLVAVLRALAVPPARGQINLEHDGASWEPRPDWLTGALPDIGGYWRPPPGDRQEST
jgi:hypothetical protein